ncbi:hypothetical protein KAW38_04850 [Candidatus Micrarchaeota archaeon]|nr:hypothetical protein [Candidatus Micrarchaeota archaeon]
MNQEVENALSTTTKLLFGKELTPLDEYEGWLRQHIGEGENIKTKLTGENIRLIKQYRFLELIPKEKIVSFYEGETKASEIKIKELKENMTLNELLQEIPEIAYFNVDVQVGKNKNNTETMGLEDTVNTYRANDAFNSKNIAYSSYTKYSEFIFGSFRVFYSKFCINCYNCVRATVAFECDSVKDSTNAYFCHNCENVHDALFCSNAKNLKYAVGNVEVGRDAYQRVRKILVDGIIKSLEKKGGFETDIFNTSSEQTV